MSVKEFDAKFGLVASIEEEKKRFVNRMELTVLEHFSNFDIPAHYVNLLNDVCYVLGEDLSEHTRRERGIPKLKVLDKKDFLQTLRLLVALYRCVNNRPQAQQYISSHILDALDRSTLNLGVKWADGVFYPTGDNLLDKELIDTSLSLLDRYPNEKKNLQLALDNHYKKNLYGVVDNCYLTSEGLGRKLLNNTKNLDNNKEELLRLIQFSKQWNAIFANYIQYAHEYSRHASANRHDLKPGEVEGFLYLTCLMVRAVIRANDERNKQPQ